MTEPMQAVLEPDIYAIVANVGNGLALTSTASHRRGRASPPAADVYATVGSQATLDACNGLEA